MTYETQGLAGAAKLASELCELSGQLEQFFPNLSARRKRFVFEK